MSLHTGCSWGSISWCLEQSSCPEISSLAPTSTRLETIILGFSCEGETYCFLRVFVGHVSKRLLQHFSALLLSEGPSGSSCWESGMISRTKELPISNGAVMSNSSAVYSCGLLLYMMIYTMLNGLTAVISSGPPQLNAGCLGWQDSFWCKKSGPWSQCSSPDQIFCIHPCRHVIPRILCSGNVSALRWCSTFQYFGCSVGHISLELKQLSIQMEALWCQRKFDNGMHGRRRTPKFS